jgi:hypothetical protein
MILAMLLMLALVLGACGVAPAPTATPEPMPVPQADPVALLDPAERVFAIDTEASVLRYRAQGQGALGVIEIPGTFKLAGHDVVLTPEGGGYWLDVLLVVDGTTATAPNGLFLNVLRTTLEIERYPTATFVGRSDNPIQLDSGPVQLRVTGELELHGRKRALSLLLVLTYEDGLLRATGQVSLDLHDYDAVVPTAIMSSQIVFMPEITSREVEQTP